jgi:thiamine-phosphate pyrophosphorylase
LCFNIPVRLQLPRLYPILDVSCFPEHDSIFSFADALIAAGCKILQYRNKTATAREMLSDARELRRRLGRNIILIMNDRADLAIAADFDGVHLGQDDLSVEAARRVLGPDRIIGASTHNPEQLAGADRTSADYLAIGPVYATRSKANPDPVVGIEGVRKARELTDKPLVAIGGIEPANARAVVDAGADSLALISSLPPEPRKSISLFQQHLL